MSMSAISAINAAASLAASLVTLTLCTAAAAHDAHTARYLANEGVMVASGPHEDPAKILFDPFFHNDYGTYQTVPEKMRAAMMAGDTPFDGIDAVFISHAHGDHFDAGDVNQYLGDHPSVQLIAPAQAVDSMQANDQWRAEFTTRITPIALERGDPAQTIILTRTGRDAPLATIMAVRIPHAGWPGRAKVQNIVYRIAIQDGATVMHMGDADPNDEHYAPYDRDWKAQRTNLAFSPYWFFQSPQTHAIVKERMNVQSVIGVHVPADIPPGLSAAKQQYGVDFFANPGETRAIYVPVE